MTSGESLGQRGLYRLASGLVLCLAASSCVTASPTLGLDLHPSGCIVNGVVYRHLDLLRTEYSLKIICVNGSVAIYQAGLCNVGGIIYSNGQIFTLPGDSPSFYLCNNGSASIYGNRNIHIYEGGLCNVGGIIYSRGEIVDLHGYPQSIEFICNNGSVIIYKAADLCHVRGTIYSNGQIFTLPEYSPCVRYRCNNGSVSIYKEGCQDANGVCHNLGSTFTFAIGGKLYQNCTCIDNAINSQYGYRCTR